MDWVETTAIVVQAFAVAAAGYAAWRGLTTWRHEMTARRRAELAEHTMAMFYEARDLIAWARFPGCFGDEGSSRERQSNETEDEARYKNTLYVPMERLSRQAEFWGRFEAGRYPFMAVFGEEAAKPFNTVRQIGNRVSISARMLMQTYGRAKEERKQQQQQRKWEGDIWAGSSEKDALASQIDNAVSTMEKTCEPAITGMDRGAGPPGRIKGSDDRIGPGESDRGIKPQDQTAESDHRGAVTPAEGNRAGKGEDVAMLQLVGGAHIAADPARGDVAAVDHDQEDLARGDAQRRQNLGHGVAGPQREPLAPAAAAVGEVGDAVEQANLDLDDRVRRVMADVTVVHFVHA